MNNGHKKKLNDYFFYFHAENSAHDLAMKISTHLHYLKLMIISNEHEISMKFFSVSIN